MLVSLAVDGILDAVWLDWCFLDKNSDGHRSRYLLAIEGVWIVNASENVFKEMSVDLDSMPWTSKRDTGRVVLLLTQRIDFQIAPPLDNKTQLGFEDATRRPLEYRTVK